MCDFVYRIIARRQQTKAQQHAETFNEYQKSQVVDMYGKHIYPELATKYQGVFVPAVYSFK